ncbi:RHS repeat domain-containing protein [Persicobacter diffluens]|uniref:DUF4595 domain-containing protein n=1 Tax=Persicobacter diffluens TaxID=981 RepID=A0AAN5AM41_9BACT|nr:hypothetical protein PEDI_39690 [Persicobacter diffluens]
MKISSIPFAFLLTCIFTFSSCSDDPTDDHGSPNPACSLLSVNYAGNEQGASIQGLDTLIYNNQGQVTSHIFTLSVGRSEQPIFEESDSMAFSYNAGGQLTQVTFEEDNFIRYEYDASGRVSRELYHFDLEDQIPLRKNTMGTMVNARAKARVAETVTITYNEFSYEGDARYPSLMNTYFGSPQQSLLVYKCKLTIEEDNVRRMDFYEVDILGGESEDGFTTFVYDDKLNPLSVLPGPVGNHFEFMNVFGVNNTTRIRDYDRGSDGEDILLYDLEIAYTYMEQGYPATMELISEIEYAEDGSGNIEYEFLGELSAKLVYECE